MFDKETELQMNMTGCWTCDYKIHCYYMKVQASTWLILRSLPANLDSRLCHTGLVIYNTIKYCEYYSCGTHE